MIYTKRKKGEGGGGLPPFRGESKGGFEIVVTTFCNGFKIPLSRGISVKQKQRDRFVKFFSLLSTYSKPIPGFRERDLTCCLQRKIKFHYEIGLNKIRRSGLESGLDGPFGEGRNNMVFQ